MDTPRLADAPERKQCQNPEAILLDIGCGGGFFALLAARIVDKKGKVYSVHMNAVSIPDLQEQASRSNLRNLYLTVGRAEEAIVCKQCGDIVFGGMAHHDFQDPSRVLENAMTIVKPTGRLVSLDWKKEPMELGPPLRIRFSEEMAASLIEGDVCTAETMKDIRPCHCLVVAKP